MYRRERAVLLEPRGHGIVLWTLRFGDEVRKATDYFSDTKEGKPDTKLLSMVRKLIKGKTEDWDRFPSGPNAEEPSVDDCCKEENGNGVEAAQDCTRNRKQCYQHHGCSTKKPRR